MTRRLILVGLALSAILLGGSGSAAASAPDGGDQASYRLPFAPPLDTPLDYRIDIVHPQPGGAEMRFTRHFRLAFEPGDGDGDYVLTATLVGVEADAPALFVERYRATLAPMLDQPIRYRLSSAGRILALADPAAVRVIFGRFVAELSNRGEEAGSDRALAIAAVARYSALDDEALARTLFDDFDPIMAFASRHLDGAPIDLVSHHRDVVETRATGHSRLALIDADAEALRIEEQTLTHSETSDGVSQPDIVSAITYRIDRATGLATRISSRDTLATRDGRLLTRKLHELTPRRVRR
ncbi:MAG: hypothetical protein GW859_10890 [Sphingomonadales bacterium]|nr:hypothetical protein [Sphingomonadales bacterium]